MDAITPSTSGPSTVTHVNSPFGSSVDASKASVQNLAKVQHCIAHTIAHGVLLGGAVKCACIMGARSGSREHWCIFATQIAIQCITTFSGRVREANGAT
eukprot:3766396-Amphidinium_carterae.1